MERVGEELKDVRVSLRIMVGFPEEVRLEDESLLGRVEGELPITWWRGRGGKDSVGAEWEWGAVGAVRRARPHSRGRGGASSGVVRWGRTPARPLR